jgi:diguanylate cyclase (GGDEF)-like protein
VVRKKIASVFALKNFAFTSWLERPYLFRFPHGRPITGGIDVMQQNCTLMPLTGANGEVQAVCVTLFDVTDMALMQRQLEQVLVALKESANRDGLTGVYNRRHLEERLSEEFARYKRHGRELAILPLDIDHFKRVNDQYGHLAGDGVLRIAAQRVAGLIRETDVFCRYGGEEFMLILPEAGVAPAMVVAEKLRKAVCETPFEVETEQLRVTMSIGASAARPELRKYQELIKEADQALYAAKEQGRNRSIAFVPPA